MMTTMEAELETLRDTTADLRVALAYWAFRAGKAEAALINAVEALERADRISGRPNNCLVDRSALQVLADADGDH